jgi:flagellar biosynthesis/type III secretory pathway protein FliH
MAALVQQDTELHTGTATVNPAFTGPTPEPTGKNQSTHPSHKNPPVVCDTTVHDRTVLESQFVQVDNLLAAQLAEVGLLGDNCLDIFEVGPQGASGQPNVARNARLVL